MNPIVRIFRPTMGHPPFSYILILPFTNKEDADLLFQLINGRYERQSTIITTNVPFSSWGTILHNQAVAEAILDRLVYHSHVIKIKGKSYRLATAQN